MKRVPSEAAEEAAAGVMRTLALAPSLGLPPFFPGGRMTGRGVRLEDPRTFLVLPHMTTLVEDFARERLLTTVGPLIVGDHAFLRDLAKAAERQADGNWETHRAAWKKWLGIDLTSAPEYAVFDGFVEARNAVMHGAGKLTRRQLAGDGGKVVSSKLQLAGIKVVGARVSLSSETAAICATTCKRLILWIDAKLQALPRPFAVQGQTA